LSQSQRVAGYAVFGIAAGVALLDIFVGAYLLVSPTPWLAHGPDTVWTRAAEELGSHGALDAAYAALLDRVGAFSLFAGISTAVWLARSLTDRRILSTLLITYVVAGLAFGITDAEHFGGTPYLTAKRVIGGAWMLALVLHFTVARPVAAKDQT
jgi:hypothetical protein